MTDRIIHGSVSKFTPCPDVLIEKYSHTAAIIWGKIWRYCQMADGVCNASILRLARELGLTDKTILKHITALEEGGYVKDLTPTLRHAPHTYIDTGKLALRVNIFMEETPEVQKNSVPRYGKNTVKESTTKGREENNIFTAYEQNIGVITPMIAEALVEAEQTYPEGWVLQAMALAVHNNKRNWRYIETILKRWTTDGKDEGKGKPASTFEDALKAAGYK